MDTAILSVHVLVCVVLIILVLLQTGQNGMGVIFGGGNSSTFGTGGAGNLLTKLTTFLALTFVCTSLAYNIMISAEKNEGSSILDVQFEEVVPTPITPTPVPSVEIIPSTEAIETNSTEVIETPVQ